MPCYFSGGVDFLGGLLDDLDKELNTYAMRVREWYGWHFPELSKVVADNIVFAKLVRLIGTSIL